MPVQFTHMFRNLARKCMQTCLLAMNHNCDWLSSLWRIWQDRCSKQASKQTNKMVLIPVGIRNTGLSHINCWTVPASEFLLMALEAVRGVHLLLHCSSDVNCLQGVWLGSSLLWLNLLSTCIFLINPPTFGTFFIQVDAPFETIRYCGFEWWNNCVQCCFPKWYWMVGQLIQNLVWIFPNGSTANTKPCLDLSKW